MIITKRLNMGKILVFRSLEKRILTEKDKQFSLFGDRDLVGGKIQNYDLIFHAIENIQFKELETIEEVTNLVIPVLPLKNGYDHKDIYKLEKISDLVLPFMIDKEDKIDLLDMYKLNKENPLLDTFALRKLNSLDFYRAIKNKKGVEIKNENYSLANETDIFKMFGEKLYLDLTERIKKINKKYYR